MPDNVVSLEAPQQNLIGEVLERRVEVTRNPNSASVEARKIPSPTPPYAVLFSIVPEHKLEKTHKDKIKK